MKALGDWYQVKGAPEYGVLAFYVDVIGEAKYFFPLSVSQRPDTDHPVIKFVNDYDDEIITVEYPNLPGWQAHSVDGGSTLAICLVKV
jgi:hypothetical protein